MKGGIKSMGNKRTEINIRYIERTDDSEQMAIEMERMAELAKDTILPSSTEELDYIMSVN
jgi:hypothetical protein